VNVCDGASSTWRDKATSEFGTKRCDPYLAFGDVEDRYGKSVMNYASVLISGKFGEGFKISKDYATGIGQGRR